MSVNTHGLGCSHFARRYYGNRKNLLPDHNGTQLQIPQLYRLLGMTTESGAGYSIRKKAPCVAFYSFGY